MMDKKCTCSDGGHGDMMPDCCREHKMSKEHLEAKKEDAGRKTQVGK